MLHPLPHPPPSLFIHLPCFVPSDIHALWHPILTLSRVQTRTLYIDLGTRPVFSVVMKLRRLNTVVAVVYLLVIIGAVYIVYRYLLSSGQSSLTIPIYNRKSPDNIELNILDRELTPQGSWPSSLTGVSTTDIPPLTPTTLPAYLSLPILYLVQTEKCLPPYLLSNDVLGNGSLRFEVMVLSYKEPCDNPPKRHIQYILNSATTWSTGRNFLFESAMHRKKTYLYYIFMDDDIVLSDIKQANPWRKFEAFLRSVEPAIAAIDLTQDNNLQMIRNIHRDRQCSREDVYMSSVWFDAIFNAFHYNAVHRILPYDSTFDTQTWYASQMAVIARSEVLFRGQVVLHTEVVGENREHRPYPKGLEFSHAMFESWLSGLAERHVPPNHLQCANVYVHQWITMEGLHGWNSSTMCLPPPPPHDVIEPGRYACA